MLVLCFLGILVASPNLFENGLTLADTHHMIIYESEIEKFLKQRQKWLWTKALTCSWICAALICQSRRHLANDGSCARETRDCKHHQTITECVNGCTRPADRCHDRAKPVAPQLVECSSENRRDMNLSVKKSTAKMPRNFRGYTIASTEDQDRMEHNHPTSGSLNKEIAI